MRNLDVAQNEKKEILARINTAVKDGDEAAFSEAFGQFAELLQESVMAEARGMVQAADNAVLMGRGVRALTTEEKKYYNSVLDGMRSSNPKQALSDIEKGIPTTIIDAVLEDITEAHPLLSEINFQNTGYLTSIVVSVAGQFKASWYGLCDEVQKNLAGSFKTIDLTQRKLSAFIPVCKGMLEMGPEWLDRYVRSILAESVANGLEAAIINGSGLKDPTGMMRDVDSALNPHTGYDPLVPVPVSNLSAETYGGVLALLAKNRNNLYRTVNEVLFICNPADYYTKVIPAVTDRLSGDVRWAFPTRVIQSVHVPANTAIVGIGKNYFFGAGAGSGGRIEYSDHVKFLEDERVYLTKLYGNGTPIDNTSFVVLDITDVRPDSPVVRVADYVDARLAGISIVDELTAPVNIGVFNKSVHAYYGAVADDSTPGDNDTITLSVTKGNDNATLVVKLGSSVKSANGQGAYEIQLSAGANVLTITSLVDGVEKEAYVVVLTYTAAV